LCGVPGGSCPGRVDEREHGLAWLAEHGDGEARRDAGAVVNALTMDDVATWLPEGLASPDDTRLKLGHHPAAGMNNEGSAPCTTVIARRHALDRGFCPAVIDSASGMETRPAENGMRGPLTPQGTSPRRLSHLKLTIRPTAGVAGRTPALRKCPHASRLKPTVTHRPAGLSWMHQILWIRRSGPSDIVKRAVWLEKGNEVMAGSAPPPSGRPCQA